ncbi:MAG: hypothetical protein PHI55_00910 [Burkholderiaceae bacterium]|nr:hypothetical protein [Burkholderiaceae bacterium]
MRVLFDGLEVAAKAGNAVRARERLAALPAALAAVRQALAEADAPAPAAAAAPSPADPSLSAAQQAEVRQALAQLVPACQAGELADAALATLAGHLPPSALQPLQAALDRFDFERAQRCLQALQAQWTPPLEDMSP